MMVDWDAHHGNSQQQAFWDDSEVLTVSIHQEVAGLEGGSSSPSVEAIGGGKARGMNINIPLPAGSGGLAYRQVFERIVEPAADNFQPGLLLVSCGLDANNIDPSSRLRLNSADYAELARRILILADRHASGRAVFMHEGGYALEYAPWCFLAIMQVLTGTDVAIEDPFTAVWGTNYADDQDGSVVIPRVLAALSTVTQRYD